MLLGCCVGMMLDGLLGRLLVLVEGELRLGDQEVG